MDRIGFHAKENWFFRRLPNGSVEIAKSAGMPDHGINRFSVVLAENEWASVVCSVSKDGETHERWMLARHFHGPIPSETFDALNGMVGLVQLLLARDDLPVGVRETLVNNHRITAARDALARSGAA